MKSLKYLITKNTKIGSPFINNTINNLIKSIEIDNYPYLYKFYGRDFKKKLLNELFIDKIKQSINIWNSQKFTNFKYQDIADYIAYCAIIWILGIIDAIYEESWNGYDWAGEPDLVTFIRLDEIGECEFLSGDMDQLISYADNQDLLNSIDKSDLEELTAFMASHIKYYIIS